MMTIIRALGSFVLSLISLSELQSPTSNPIIQINNLYTSDLVPFYFKFLSNVQLEALGYSLSDPESPLLTTILDITNLDDNDSIISGTVYIEYGQYQRDLSTDPDPCSNHGEYTYSHPFQLNGGDPHHPNHGFTEIKQSVMISQSGTWFTSIYICIDDQNQFDDDEHDESINTISTLIDLKAFNLKLSLHHQALNPLGHLGFEFMALPFLFVLTLMYGICILFWMYWTCRYPSNWSPSVHSFLLSGIMYIFVESACRFVLYKSYNLNGAFSPSTIGIMIISLGVTWSCQLTARLGVMLLSTGYGIVHRTIPSKTIWFSIGWSVGFTVIHIISFGTNPKMKMGLSLHQFDHHDHHVFATQLYHATLVVSVMLDVVLCWIVLENILNVREDLKKFKNTVKAKIYRDFLASLAVCFGMYKCAVAANIWIHYHQLMDDPQYWKMQWFLQEGVWRLIALMFTLSQAYIWKPQRHLLEFEKVTQGLLCRRNIAVMRANPLTSPRLSVPGHFDEFLSHSDQERLLESDSESGTADTWSSVTRTSPMAGLQATTANTNLSEYSCPDIENFLRFKQLQKRENL